MIELLAYCGLSCQTCPIYLAARQENIEEKTRTKMEIIRVCKELYGIDYQLADITDCDGCQTDGTRLFPACQSCPIRQCAREKKLENCAYCPEYACAKLEAFFKTEQSAKTRLDTIRMGWM